MLLENYKLSQEAIWLPGNTPSSKNEKIKTKWGIVEGPICKAYRKKYTKYYSRNAQAFRETKVGISKPYLVGFHFVRDSARRFDFHNIVQIVADIMVDKMWIFDDCMDEFIPVPLKNSNGKYFSKDTSDPGVYVKILNKKSNDQSKISK